MSKIISKYIECYIYKKFSDGIKYLLLKRSPDKKPYPGIWQIVTGNIKKNEKAFETAIRELKEETGLSPVHLFTLPDITQFYAPQNDTINLITLFLAEVKSSKVIISPEHSEFVWLDYPTALKKIYWLNQKKILTNIQKILADKNLFKTLYKLF